jgi:hypothetical protein
MIEGLGEVVEWATFPVEKNGSTDSTRAPCNRITIAIQEAPNYSASISEPNIFGGLI